MAYLYWSCTGRPQEAERLLGYLDDSDLQGKILPSDFPVILIPHPTVEALRLTAELLLKKHLGGAALVVETLSQDKLWISLEWHGRLVVEHSSVDVMRKLADCFHKTGEHAQLNLVIFEPVKAADTGGDSDYGDGRVQPAAQVRERPEDYYGDLADPAIGGASALYAAGLEMARAKGLHDQVIVDSPEALGFEFDANEHSVTVWQKKSIIRAHAVGFSLSSFEEVVGLFHEHRTKLDLTELQPKISAWRSEGISFGIGLVLVGLEDPPIVIPMGSVDQQPSIGSPMQNLAVAQGTKAMVAAGATVPLILPAWCLNPTFASPSGPLAPTPLVSMSAGGSQEAVWSRVRDRYGGGS
jgi:hypothetical protein